MELLVVRFHTGWQRFETRRLRTEIVPTTRNRYRKRPHLLRRQRRKRASLRVRKALPARQTIAPPTSTTVPIAIKTAKAHVVRVHRELTLLVTTVTSLAVLVGMVRMVITTEQTSIKLAMVNYHQQAIMDQIVHSQHRTQSIRLTMREHLIALS